MSMRPCVLAVLTAVGCLVAVAEALPPLPDGAVTLAVIPDTQRYSGEGTRVRPGQRPQTGPVRNDAFVTIIDWLLANCKRERIFFVSHTGDIVDNRNALQFEFAARQMSRLDGIVPYGIAPGNHDLVRGYDSSCFSAYFPAAKFAKEPWYAGHFDGCTNAAGKAICGDNADSCQLVEALGMKFVILHVECNAPDPVLAWVDAQLTKYADRAAIISTHQDLGFFTKADQDAWNAGDAKTARAAQRLRDAGQPVVGPVPHPDRARLGRMRWKKCHGEAGNTPQQAWEKCYSRHANVLLVVSGDQGPVNVMRTVTVGSCGNRVCAAMHDNQSHSLRLYRFHPGLKRIDALSVDPVIGELLTVYCGWTDRGDHNFTWDLSK